MTFDRIRKAKDEADEAKQINLKLSALGNMALGALVAINNHYPEATNTPIIQEILADYAVLKRKIASYD